MAPISIDSLASEMPIPPKHLIPIAIDLQEIHDRLIFIAHVAGDMMLKATQSTRLSEIKSNTSDQVTATDRAIENMVKAVLKLHYPHFEFLGEETFKTEQKLGNGPTFICDPIDGTLNFIHGFPGSAVSLALAIDKKAVVGVVFNPARKELYSAIQGRGAYLSRGADHVVRLPVRDASPLQGLSSSLIGLEWGSQRCGSNWDLRTRTAMKLMSAADAGGQMCHSLRSSGSAALTCCYVAAGFLDLWWEGGCWVWDVCAAWIILEEAGGIMASANPGDWTPSLEGRAYLAVRGAPTGQKELVEEMWGCMDGQFVF